jgi:transcriptional regulator with XRE-family HTH domain
MSDGHGPGNGLRLRLARQARGFSQQQLAAIARVSQQAISAVESGFQTRRCGRRWPWPAPWA